MPFTIHYIAGQTPYTDAELAALHALVHDAAEAEDLIPPDELEARHCETIPQDRRSNPT